ncbi:MAG TPA: SDR family NAD(P)-dependent oxidoreductase [Steroidobacteraceae bacterium]|nr:SDR family NAD(P)-dependent oxidoreductase [Steroidobacteraceae bacterium]
MDLTKRKIAVTGAFGALGAAVCVAVKAAGGDVACIVHGPAAKAPPALAGYVVVDGIDLSKPADATRAMESAAQQLGGLDGLVNTAGGFQFEKITDGDIATWERMFDVNLRTVVNASRAALPFMKSGSGRIVNVGSNAANKGTTGTGAYAASKAGVARLTEALADELKTSGVTVNAVLPSIIDTPANRADMPKADFSKWVTTAQIADLIVYLLSERSSAVTGALIPIVGRV